MFCSGRAEIGCGRVLLQLAAQGRQGRFEGANEGIEPPAPREDVLRMFAHFEDELERAGYFYPPEKNEVMKNNLRTAFLRGTVDLLQEVRTFRGAIKALALGRGKARAGREEKT